MKNFAEQMMNAATGLANSVAAISPLGLVVGILGIAAVNGLIEYSFQMGVFSPGYALGFAIIITCFRFATGFGGIHLIKNQVYPLGVLFVATSAGITWYIASHLKMYAGSVTLPGVNIELSMHTLMLIVWGGLWGEVLLAGFVMATQQKATQNANTNGNGLLSTVKGFISGNNQNQEPTTATNRVIVKGFAGDPNENRIDENRGDQKLSEGNRLCVHCGSTYQYRHHKQKYCTDACRIAAWEIRNGRTLKRGKQ